MIFNLLQQLA